MALPVQPGVAYDAGFLNAALNNPGRLSDNWANCPPIMKLNYTYKHNFPTVVGAVLKKYNWEGRSHLTSIANVQ